MDNPAPPNPRAAFLNFGLYRRFAWGMAGPFFRLVTSSLAGKVVRWEGRTVLQPPRAAVQDEQRVEEVAQAAQRVEEVAQAAQLVAAVPQDA